MLDEFDRRAEQEAVAMNNLRKYQVEKRNKPILRHRGLRTSMSLYNNIARAGTMPSTIIKKRITKRRAVKTIKKQIPVFSLGD